MTDNKCDKTVYVQNCEDFRSLNNIMWRVPILVMSLTGGLLVAVATFELSDPARQGILVFAGLINLAFIVVLYRLRYVMDRILKQIHAYQGTKYQKGFRVVLTLSAILLISMLGSFYSAWEVSDMFRTSVDASLECENGIAKISVADHSDSDRVLLSVVCDSEEPL